MDNVGDGFKVLPKEADFRSNTREPLTPPVRFVRGCFRDGAFLPVGI
jgi:hypothetical protein